MMQSRQGRNKNLQNLTKSGAIAAGLSVKFWLMFVGVLFGLFPV
jgi:uncharacterized membrane protein